MIKIEKSKTKYDQIYDQVENIILYITKIRHGLIVTINSKY